MPPPRFPWPFTNGPGAVNTDNWPFRAAEIEVPGGVYLCQVSEQVSCGACCGLYNRVDVSRETLYTLLEARTRRFRRIQRTAEGIEAFRQREESLDSAPGPYPDFYRCPFLGLVGNDRSRVGCLLHPLSDGNKGIDFRGLSFYGGLACRRYFCPSHRSLDKNRKQIVKAVCANWHLYGLVIPDVEFINVVFSEIERRVEHAVEAKEILGNTAAAMAMRALFGFKERWPFRPVGWKGSGNYFFNDAAHPALPVDYQRPGVAPSEYDAFFQALGSEFTSRSALDAAEAMAASAFSRVTRCIQR